MPASYEVIFIRDWLEFSIAFVSLFCSLLTLYIIYRLKVWNGNVLLICTLTIFQALYDINFLFGPSDYYSTCIIWNFLDLLGGLGTAFTTNVIAFSMVYIVVRIKSIDIIKNYKYLFLFMGVIPFAVACMGMFVIVPAKQDDDKPFTNCVFNESTFAHAIQSIYYWSRIGSIVFNFLAFWYISYKIRRLGFQSTSWNRALSSLAPMNSSDQQELAQVRAANRARTDSSIHLDSDQSKSATSTSKPLLTVPEQQTLAVRIIASRMRFYPFAQAICRSGSAWNEYDNYHYSNDTSSIMASICAPLTGIFYMIIFLVMQPNAWKMCKVIFSEWYLLITCNNSEQQRNSQGFPTRTMQEHSRVSLNHIFRMSASLLDDTTLESIINFPAGETLSDWNQHLSSLLYLGGTNPSQLLSESELGRPNSTTVNTLHENSSTERDDEGL